VVSAYGQPRAFRPSRAATLLVRPLVRLRNVLLTFGLAVAPARLLAQPSYRDLTVNDVGIAIGDAPRVTGLRINFRDRYLQRVNGVNITVWTPGSASEAAGASAASTSPASVSAEAKASQGSASPASALAVATR
jgi:hypothetical protein